MLVYRRVGVFKPLKQTRDVVGSFSKAMEREGEGEVVSILLHVQRHKWHMDPLWRRVGIMFCREWLKQ